MDNAEDMMRYAERIMKDELSKLLSDKGIIPIQLWREAIEDELRKLLLIAGIDPTDEKAISYRCKCQTFPNEERFLVDDQSVLIANYEKIEGEWIFNVISPITEGELNV